MADNDKFDYSIEDRPAQDASILRLKGPIDAFSYLSLKALLARWTEGSLDVPKRSHLAVDFRGVSYAASSGWSVIFLQSSLMREAGRQLILFGLGERAAHSLRLLEQRQQLVQTAGDEGAAMKMLESAPVVP
jgi:anti-anti-sigma regulatory factor